MKTSPISVILPNYNHAHCIGRQLDALLSQSVRPLEVIVVDDASTDDSVAVIERFARADAIVRLMRNEKNLGVIKTVNRGLQECRGDFVYGVAADDIVQPGCLERVMRMIERHPNAGIYFGQIRAMMAPAGSDSYEEACIYAASRWTEERFATPESFLYDYLEVESCRDSPSAATVYRRHCLEEVGAFREELGHWCDTFAIRAIGLKYGACYTPSVQAEIYGNMDSFGNRQGRNVRIMLDIVGRAAWLMRSPEFRDRFPEAHVARWEKLYRESVIINYINEMRGAMSPIASGAAAAPAGRRPIARWVSHRARQALSRVLVGIHWRRLHAYAPNLSCYSSGGNRSLAVRATRLS